MHNVTYSIFVSLLLLLGYVIGRRVGRREGLKEGLALAPIILRKQMNIKGKCPICDKDNCL
ncbi:hypothetical protein [Brassicibacter mesophilus]|uniref:hypothetical protein n=1 Tax=Brassicibacter mesophilus TaxID=745119 RepID=UPI003D2592B0